MFCSHLTFSFFCYHLLPFPFLPPRFSCVRLPPPRAPHSPPVLSPPLGFSTTWIYISFFTFCALTDLHRCFLGVFYGSDFSNASLKVPPLGVRLPFCADTDCSLIFNSSFGLVTSVWMVQVFWWRMLLAGWCSFIIWSFFPCLPLPPTVNWVLLVVVPLNIRVLWGGSEWGIRECASLF